MIDRESTMAADLLDRVRGEIAERLQGLRPAVEEYERLLEAVQALERDGARNANATPPARPSRLPASARTPPPPAEQPAPRQPPDVLDARAGNHASAADGEPAVTNHAPPAPVARDREPAVRDGLAPVGNTASARKARAGEAEKAIVAALEHGSHTVGELGIVTAMSGQDIRTGARRLLASGRIVRASREGRAAYALSGSE
jgi:hypothetical protein